MLKRPGRPPVHPPRSKPGAEQATDRPGLAARRCAARLLAAVVEAHASLDGLTDANGGHPQFRALEPRDRALVRAILVSALRFRRTIERMIAARLDRPLPANATALSHILHVAAAQILFLDAPDSAAVDLAVSHAQSDPRTRRFAGLVNAVLRHVARDRDTRLAPLLSAHDDAPDWFSSMLVASYGVDAARAILAAHRVEPAIDFTVRADAPYWAERLGGIVLPTGSVRVARLASSVPDLPGYADGAWWVQDAAAALPARLFGDVAGLSVLDMCAAPGGKTAQLAAAGARVTALDISESRLKRLAVNLDRLKLGAEIVAADAFAYAPEKPFDAVLLDAPCSSTGTVRRHPDVPWTKSPNDIARLADLQTRLLDRAADLVKPGGTIVFSNCSLDPSEGEGVLAAVLARRSDLALDPLVRGYIPGLDNFITDQGTLRTTPADLDLGDPALSGLDGFFAAKLRRIR